MQESNDKPLLKTAAILDNTKIKTVPDIEL